MTSPGLLLAAIGVMMVRKGIEIIVAVYRAQM